MGATEQRMQDLLRISAQIEIRRDEKNKKMSDDQDRAAAANIHLPNE